MIARLTWTDPLDEFPTPAVATLGDDLRWTCETAGDPTGLDAICSLLNTLYSPLDEGPEYGSPGHQKAHDAARWLKATSLEFELKRSAPPGAVH
ncbi:MAG: hypothetical protein ABI353_11145 [Isosphaeraceae bacterium]